MKNWRPTEGLASSADAYFLACTGDDTDRTAEIEEKLRIYGVCLLGSGIYYVCDIHMPEHTTLMGMGDATTLLLRPDAEEGSVVRMQAFCTVKDLGIKGAAETIELPREVGKRHGILFAGTATMENWKENSLLQPRNATISGCHIASFTGGGLTCVDTGYYCCASLTVCNCHILNCGSGIHIPHFSEYHEFTNVLCSENLYGCINNGGNNMFVNCSFTGNKVGFMLDNSDGRANNNAHGSAVGCTFNHSDENNGIGVLMIGASSGYVFSGCQFFFSKIVLENAVGIMIHSSNFGRQVEIRAKGKQLTVLSDCVFLVPPTLTAEDDAMLRLCNCYTKQGEEVVFPAP